MQNTDATIERTETRKVSPVISILDPRFKYVNAASTDLRATFARVRQEMAKKPENVRTITKRRA